MGRLGEIGSPGHVGQPHAGWLVGQPDRGPLRTTTRVVVGQLESLQPCRVDPPASPLISAGVTPTPEPPSSSPLSDENEPASESRKRHPATGSQVRLGDVVDLLGTLGPDIRRARQANPGRSARGDPSGLHRAGVVGRPFDLHMCSDRVPAVRPPLIGMSDWFQRSDDPRRMASGALPLTTLGPIGFSRSSKRAESVTESYCMRRVADAGRAPWLEVKRIEVSAGRW